MLPIPEIDDATAAFPALPPLPAWDEIPEQFKRFHDPFAEIVTELFLKGGRLSDFGLTPKEGVDPVKARRAIAACLRSFAPKHEHKTAGVAYMLSEWFDRASQAGE